MWAQVRGKLHDDDELLWCGYITPAAPIYETSAARPTSAVINSVLGLIKKARHIGGEPDSIARSLSRDGTKIVALSLSTSGLTWMQYSSSSPRVAHHVRMSDIEAIELRSRSRAGSKERLRFADGSFFDVGVTYSPPWGDLHAAFEKSRT
ncbi:MAG TPA: hypothetical protein PLZ93_09420 [Nocardioides sp.]|nr:hypothetical protein [Nocardioides sp.]HRI95820.1 hypothetical protein [Nocardioides sp.]HRK45961.1 hypothetical protein [Nocardioides sp.]